jgi:hypothetical protein
MSAIFSIFHLLANREVTETYLLPDRAMMKLLQERRQRMEAARMSWAFPSDGRTTI